MNIIKNVKYRYETIVYDGQEITTKNITRKEVMGLVHRSTDYFLSKTLGTWTFKTQAGKWIDHHDGIWPGLGNTSIKIIQALQFNPAEFLEPKDISELTGYFTLRDNNALSACLMRIRHVHKESAQKPHFFLSRKTGGYGICWNPKCHWMWCERIGPITEVTE
jgi:hypothetical protein